MTVEDRQSCLSGLRCARPVADDDYKSILQRADAFFGSVTKSQPQNLQCGRGCSLCCYGLFEIGSGDVPVIAEGLAKLQPARRRKIIRKAQEIIDANDHPNLRECDPIDKESFFDRTASVACPNLSDSGECQIYDSRPLVCRTFGLPLRNAEEYIGDVCELNFTEASEAQKHDAAWDLQWEDELGPEDEYTIPEAIVLAARMRGWLGT
jgi:Fe-S-cluster containining protein